MTDEQTPATADSADHTADVPTERDAPEAEAPAAEDTPAAPAPIPAATPAATPAAAEHDELEQVTAELRRLRARRSLRPTQAAFFVLLALIVGAVIAPLLWLGHSGQTSTVPATDPAVAALQAYERTVDGRTPAAGDADAIKAFVHVRTDGAGNTVATARSHTGACYVLTIPAVTSSTQSVPGVRSGATTECG